MTRGDRPYEGEYPGQMGMPFDDEPGRSSREPGRPHRDAGRPQRPEPDPDDDLFVWDLQPRREQPRRPADREAGDWPVPESGAGATGSGSCGERDACRTREALDLRQAREALERFGEPPRGAGGRPSHDSRGHRTAGYAAGGGRPPRGTAGGYEAGEEWAEPEGPHGPEAVGPLPERHKGPRRRRRSAGAVLLAMLLGFFVAGLLDAWNIKREVEARPYGALRTLQLALLAPMTGLSGLVHADDLGTAVADALGRGEEEHHTIADVKKKAKKPLWPRAITAKKPLRLYIAGDSMDQVFGSSLVNLSEATGLVKAKNDYKVSSGLTRPDFYDWPQRLVDQIVDYRPDAAVVLFGANDAQNVLYDGRILKVGTKEWQEVYAQRVGEVMDILTEGERRVYWVGQPIMKDFGYRQRIAMMNHIYAAEAKKREGVTFVSTWKVMANDKGSYAEYLEDENGDQVLVRAPDGIHLSRAGGDRMARHVFDVIEKDWGMSGPTSSGSAP